MIGQIIQSYLVSLGVQIDKPGFQQADATIKQTGEAVERVAGNMGHSFGAMARNFIKASTIIGSAMAGVTASVAGLMKSVASEDLAMQKYARSMMMGEDAAWRMKKATDALGESINDIALTPELLGRFTQLTADGSKMKVGGDFKQTMKDFRDLMFEFTRLKQEASYALNWVGYYLMKYLQKPLADIREKFKAFNDIVIKGMSSWTEKIARAIYYVIEVGHHFLDFVVDMGKHVKELWDSFPDGVKKAIVAITALQAVLAAGPIGRSIMLISTLLLLIDDYYGYMEGKDAALGQYWDKLNEYISIAKKRWEELKPIAEEYWNRFVGFLQTARTWVEELGTKVKEFLDRVSQSEELQRFIALLEDLGEKYLQRVVQNVQDLYEWLKSLYERLEENGAVASFNELLEKLYRAVMWVVEQVRDLVEFMGRLHDEVVKTEEYQEFTNAIADLAAVFLELLNTVADLAGDAMRLMFGEMSKTDKVLSFRDVMRAVLKVFTALISAVKWVVDLFNDLFKTIQQSNTFKSFWETIGGLIDSCIGKLGKFGRALLALANSKGLADGIKKAMSILGADDEDNSNKNKSKGKSADAGRGGINAFMNAIGGQESGDNYDAENSDSGAAGRFQIMPENWPSWAEDAGLGADAPMTPANQDKVAKHKMLQYYEQFGNWRDVAIAWYAGPGAVDYSEEAKNRKQYSNGKEYPSINEYADSVMDRMGLNRDGSARHTSNDGGDVDSDISLDPEINVWHSVGGETDVNGLRPRTIEAANALKLALPNGMTITGGSEKGYHMETDENGNELQHSHVKGYKFDLSFDEIPPGSGAAAVLRNIVENIYGGRVVQEGDHWDCFVPDGPSKLAEVRQMLGMSSNAQEVHNAASSDDQGNPIGYQGGASIAQANQDLQNRFNEALSAMRANGYDFYVQSASENSIGFTSPAPDVHNIEDVLRSYGLNVSRDEHGFYVSLPSTSGASGSWGSTYGEGKSGGQGASGGWGNGASGSWATPTAYTAQKGQIKPLGLAGTDKLPHKYDDLPRPEDLDGFERGPLQKIPVQKTTTAPHFAPTMAAPAVSMDRISECAERLEQIVNILQGIHNDLPQVAKAVLPEVGGNIDALPWKEIQNMLEGIKSSDAGKMMQEAGKIFGNIDISGLQKLPAVFEEQAGEFLPKIRGCFDHLEKLGEMAGPIIQQMESGFNPASVANTVTHNNNSRSTAINLTMNGGINLHGIKNAIEAARAIPKALEQDMDFWANNRTFSGPMELN